MSQNSNNSDKKNIGFENCEKELSSLLKFFKNENINLEDYLVEIHSLKEELNSVKEINNKTKEFLLLELESNLDKQKQVQDMQDSKLNSFNKIIDLLKDENDDKLKRISALNVEIIPVVEAGLYLASPEYFTLTV